MFKRSIFFILFSYQIVFSAFSQSNTKQQATLFSITKKPVTTDEFIYLYQKNHQNKPDEFTAEKIEEYLDLFINFKLKVTEAQHRGLDTTSAFKKEFNSYKDELRKPYLPDSKLLDSLVALTYNRMKEEIHVTHILINVSENAPPQDTLKAYNKIMELRSRAMQGEDFVKLAESFSEDASVKANKGNLNYFTAMQMVYPFETAAFSTAKGAISLPVKTKFGYHIIKVNDRRPSQGEIEVSHILIRTGDTKDNEQSKNTVFDIFDQLQKGVSWDDLCKQFSEDPSSKENGGRLRPFGIGVMTAVPEFERAAFELQKPGDISDPFLTQFGWHIIKLEREIPLAPLSEISATLKNKVSRDERVQISKQALYAKMKKDFGFTENPESKKRLFTSADSSLTAGKWKVPSNPNAEKETLFTLRNKSYSVNQFLNYVSISQKANALAPEKYLEQLLNSFIETQLLLVLEENIIAQSPEYKWLLKEYYEGILLFDIMEKEVWNKASIDSIGQRNYFNNNTSTYKAGERVKAKIYSATTKDHIDELKKFINQNDSIKIQQTVTSHSIKQEAGLYEKEDRSVFSKIEWMPGVKQTQNNNLYYIIVIKNILPPGLKTFDEARPEVISDYQSYLEKKWIQQLKKKFPVKVNKKEKTVVVNQLTTKHVSAK